MRGASVIYLVARWTIVHYYPSSNLGVVVFEGCFIFDFASLPLVVSAHLAWQVHKSGRKGPTIITSYD